MTTTYATWHALAVHNDCAARAAAGFDELGDDEWLVAIELAPLPLTFEEERLLELQEGMAHEAFVRGGC